MLTQDEIDRRIGSISEGLDRLAGADGDLTSSIEIDAHFRCLRDEYRRNPDALAGVVQQLSTLSRRFDEALSTRLAQIVDRFHDVNARIHEAEQEKTVWREFLIRSAIRARVERLTGGAASVRVRSMESRLIPAVGSPDREHLEEILLSSGCWDQVSQVSRPKLERALADGRLPQTHADEVQKLCPITVIHQVSSQPL